MFGPAQVMAVTGHKSVQSLSVYQRVSNEEKIKMADTLFQNVVPILPALPPAEELPCIMPPATAVPTIERPAIMPPATAVPTIERPAIMPPATAVPTIERPATIIPPATAVPTIERPAAIMPPATAVPTTERPAAIMPPATAVPTIERPAAIMPPATAVPTIERPAAIMPPGCTELAGVNVEDIFSDYDSVSVHQNSINMMRSSTHSTQPIFHNCTMNMQNLTLSHL